MDQAGPSAAGDPPASAGAAWTPPPAGLRPMLATPVAELPTEEGWAFEPKWDGYLH